MAHSGRSWRARAARHGRAPWAGGPCTAHVCHQGLADGESNALAPVGGKVRQAGRAAWRKLGLGDCPSLLRIALFAELEEVDRAQDVYLVVAEDVVHKDLRVGVANTQPTTQVNGEDAQAPSEVTERVVLVRIADSVVVLGEVRTLRCVLCSACHPNAFSCEGLDVDQERYARPVEVADHDVWDVVGGIHAHRRIATRQQGGDDVGAPEGCQGHLYHNGLSRIVDRVAVLREERRRAGDVMQPPGRGCAAPAARLAKGRMALPGHNLRFTSLALGGLAAETMPAAAACEVAGADEQIELSVDNPVGRCS